MHCYAAKGGEEGDRRAIIASFGGSEGECGGDGRRKGPGSEAFNEVRGTVEDGVKEAKEIVSEGVRGEGPCRNPRTVIRMKGSEGVKDRFRI